VMAVIGSGKAGWARPGEPQIVVFLSTQSRVRARAGQRISLHWSEPARTLRGTVIKVMPDIVSAEQARRLYAQDTDTRSGMAFPVIPVLVSPEPGRDGAPAGNDDGKLYPVRINMVSQRMFTFFPLLSRLGGAAS